MMPRTPWFLLAALAALPACHESDPSPIAAAPALAAVAVEPTAGVPGSPRENPLVNSVIPKRHQIPHGHAAEVRRLFSSGAMSYPISVVAAAGANTQFVQPKPVFIGADSFVVGAPLEFHAELDRLLASMAGMPAATSSTYEVTYWVIEADAAAATDVPPDLADIAPALQAVTGLGKRRFKGIDSVASRVLDGERAKVHGRVLNLNQTLSADPEGLRLQIELDLVGHAWADEQGRGPSLETELQVKPDTTIVLGDSTLASASDGAANLLLYVVRARRMD